MKKITTTTIPSLEGKRTIAHAENVFTGYIDSDFKNWNTDVSGNKTCEMKVDICEITENGTFKDIFGDPEKACLSQEQILWLIEHEEKTIGDWCTFFVFKSNNEYFVADARRGGGELEAVVRRFGFGGVWDAEHRARFILPQLDSVNINPLNPKPLDTLSLPDTLTINGVIYKKQ